jgi:hypothetical protein
VYKNQPVEYSNYLELFSIIITAEQVVWYHSIWYNL